MATHPVHLRCDRTHCLPAARRKRQLSTRPGVVLVIVITMLALFTLIAVTFVVSAAQFRRTAIATNRIEQLGDPPDALLNQALLQVLRGSRNPASAIGPHSLLEDLYGQSDAVVGVVTGSLGPGGPPLIDPAIPQQGASTGAPYFLPFIEISAISLGGDRQPGRAGFNDGDLLPALVTIDENDEVFQASGVNRQLRPLMYDDQVFGQIRARPSPPYPQNDTNPIVDNLIDYYAGRVITFLDGPLAGKSTFVAYSGRSMIGPLAAGTNPTFFGALGGVGPVVAGRLGLMNPEGSPASVPLRDLIGSRFIINGRPFNGAGFGYNPEKTLHPSQIPSRWASAVGTQWLDWTLDDPSLVPLGVPANDQLLALLPNPANPYYNARIRWDVGTAIHADEEYDAPDFQNLILAGREWDPRIRRWRVVAPSLHRPDLVNFWAARFTPSGSLQTWLHIPLALRRRVILRPDPADHWDDSLVPNGQWNPRDPFVDLNLDGNVVQAEAVDANGNGIYGPLDPQWEQPFANGDFDAINGPWDVDNDDNGEPDSVWVDLGMPVTTLKDGRQVKPLFAILCLDLDGRLNLNAHGSPAHYRFTIPNPPPRVSANVRYPDEVINVGTWGFLIDTRATTNPRTIVPDDPKPGVNSTRSYRMHTVPDDSVPIYPLEPVSWGVIVSNGSRAFPTYPTGQGFSPADINLGPIIGLNEGVENNVRGATPAYRANVYRWLLEGRIDVEASYGAGGRVQQPMPFAGRFGEPHLLNVQVPNAPIRPRAGMTRGGWDFSGDDNFPASTGALRLSSNTTHPLSFSGNLFAEIYHPYLGHYGTPSDLDGDGAVALDYQGQPLFINMGYSLIPNPAGNYAGPVDSRRLVFPSALTGVNPNYVTANPTSGAGFVAANLMPVFRINPVAPHPVSPDPNNPGNQPHAVAPEAIDEPTEIDLTGRRRDTFSWGQDGVPGSPSGYGDEAQPTARQSYVTGAPPPSVGSMVTSVDDPLTPNELDFMLRAGDADESGWASRRVRGVLDYRGDDDGFIDRITTESWDIPCPYVTPTPELRVALQQLGLPQTNLTLLDLLRARIKLANPSITNLIVIDRLVMAMIRPDSTITVAPAPASNYPGRCVNPDLLAGLRMDLNAPFGNGWDDNNNGVIDEPGEITLTTRERGLYGTARSRPSAPDNGLDLDLNRDGQITPAGEQLSRQDYAKQLFILMMLLKDVGYRHPICSEALGTTGTPVSGPTATALLDDLTVRRIAQFCVNVADFRDRDSICTAFEYDSNPFVNDSATPPDNNSPWDVDGNLTSKEDSRYRGVVWGVEYPDVIISETLAFHDRRVANTNQETAFDAADGDGQTAGEYFNGASATPNDATYDQVRMPQGSAFVELYATGNPNNPALSRDIYREFVEPTDSYALGPPNRPRIGVELSKVTPGGHAVWRLAVTTPYANRIDSPNNLPVRFARQPESLNFETQNLWTCWSRNGVNPPPGITVPSEADTILKLDRIVLFRGFADKTAANGAVPDKAQPYFDSATPDIYFKPDAQRETVVLPGEYAVVGPERNVTPVTLSGGGPPRWDRNPTLIGSLEENPRVALPPGRAIDLLNPRRIVLGEGNALGRPTNDYTNYFQVSDTGPDASAGNQYQRYPNQDASQPGIDSGSRHMRPPVPIPVSGVPGSSTNRVGFNISEPNIEGGNHYYDIQAPSATLATRVTINESGPGGSRKFDAFDRYNPPIDRPFDERGAREFALLPNDNWDGTHLNYKSVLLQRLADPTRDWNADTNPYITVDWSIFDLTVFNGEPVDLAAASKPADPVASTTPPTPLFFGSRERGGASGVGEQSGPGPVRLQFSFMDLWSQPNLAEPDARGIYRDWITRTGTNGTFPNGGNITTVETISTSKVKYKFTLTHSLGFLNRTYAFTHFDAAFAMPAAVADVPLHQHKWWRSGKTFAGGVFAKNDELWEDLYLGSPWRPFPWLTIHNRPFANAMELLLVPASSPSRLLREYSMRQPSPPTITTRPTTNALNFGYHYAERQGSLINLTSASASPLAGSQVTRWQSGPPYGHLLNFFRSSFADETIEASGSASSTWLNPYAPNSVPTGVFWNAADPAPNYYRLFEFVTVPSRFAGTQDVLIGGVSVTSRAKQRDSFEASNSAATYNRVWPYTIPFNRLSRYREPGKVNLNTVVDRWGSLGIRRVSRLGFARNDTEETSQDIPTVWQCLTNNFPIDWRQANPQGAGGGAVISARRNSRYQTPFVPTAQQLPQHVPVSFSPWDDLVTSREALDIRGWDRRWGPTPPVPATSDNAPTGHGATLNAGTNDLGFLPYVVRFDAAQPALFLNPYRSYLGAFNVPIRQMTAKRARFNPTSGPAPPSDVSGFNYLLAVDSTLLRRKEAIAAPGAPNVGAQGLNLRYDDPVYDPLLAVDFGFHDSYVPRLSGNNRQNPATMEARDMDADYRHTDRNPFFRYQLYTKLGGNVTIRSNVYAVWITMGLFEVERTSPFLTDNGGAPITLRYPDGFRLTREVDANVGNIKRNRLFAIIDRSIPAGFQRGENYNVDRTILIKRILE